jgi:iron complex transport system substrate-binding protein
MRTFPANGIRAVLLCACAAFAGEPVSAAPSRVMSINLCTDQYVLDLLPPERIASLYWLSREEGFSPLAGKAGRSAINYGTAEEVLAQKPDLVVAGLYTAAATRRLLSEAGVPLLELPPAEDFEAIRSNTRVMGKALGAEAKAEVLIAAMDATLAELAANRLARPIRIAPFDGSGEAPGNGTLFTAILDAAGAENVAARGSDAFFVRFDLEMLLRARPDLLAYPDAVSLTAAQRERLRHPLLRRLYAGRAYVYASFAYACGHPRSAEAAKALREAIGQGLAERGAP